MKEPDLYGQKNLTYALKHPFTHQGHEVASLTLRRPRVVDQIVASEFKGSDMKKNVYFYARLTEHPMEVIELMDYEDFISFVEASNDFLGLSGISPQI